jgi:hypothetical protein
MQQSPGIEIQRADEDLFAVKNKGFGMQAGFG